MSEAMCEVGFCGESAYCSEAGECLAATPTDQPEEVRCGGEEETDV